jgi:hypothetical protein
MDYPLSKQSFQIGSKKEILKLSGTAMLLVVLLASSLGCSFLDLPAYGAVLEAQRSAIWQGQSDGYIIKWTPQDISISRDGQLIYSARSDMSKTAHQLSETATVNKVDQEVQILSVIGPYMSLRYREKDDGPQGKDGLAIGTHPGDTFYLTVDLRNPGSPIHQHLLEATTSKPTPELQQLFGARTVLQALSADKVIKASFPKDALVSMAAFRNTLSEGSVEVQGPKLCGEFDKDFLNAFCFHHIEGNNVFIRMSISGNVECRDNLTEIGLMLPIPPNLRVAFDEAAAKRDGVMRRELLKMQSTRFSFHKKRH